MQSILLLIVIPFVESLLKFAPSLFKNAIAFSKLLRRAEAESGFRSTKGISELAANVNRTIITPV